MRTRIFAVAAVVAAIVLLGSGSVSAGTVPKLNLSSPAAVDDYLRSIGVDPATVVKQVGLLNYAGPSCPGIGWSCTTSTNVVQIASAGGQNSFECSGKPAATTTTGTGPDSCLVVQTAPAKGENQATCRESSNAPVVTQVCTIVQDNVGGGNHADVHQDSDANSGDATTGQQDARQFAHVTQSSDGGNNHSDVFQSARQSLSSGTVQHQDAHQVAFVEQSVTGSSNFSHVHESQDQSASGGGLQEQNTETAPTITVGTQVFDFDCGPEKVAEPNQCANVAQDGLSAPSGATNESHLHQAIGERETTTAGTSTQQQGRFDGGQEGNIHQDNPEDLGKNLDNGHQDLAQRASAPTGASSFHHQSQLTDPGCCGVGSQVGGDESRENVDQATTQSGTEPLAAQSSTLFGQVHQVPSEEIPLASVTQPSSPNNTCDIDQHGRNNTGAGHFSANGTGAECISLVLVTNCESGGEVPAPPATPACTSTVDTGGPPPPPLLIIASSPTNGASIPMPDYTSEPSDFTSSP